VAEGSRRRYAKLQRDAEQRIRRAVDAVKHAPYASWPKEAVEAVRRAQYASWPYCATEWIKDRWSSVEESLKTKRPSSSKFFRGREGVKGRLFR
jgi:hypothetical protein